MSRDSYSFWIFLGDPWAAPKKPILNMVKNRTCYYFDDTIKIEDFDIDNILIEEKSYENISVYNISYQRINDSKSLHIWFDSIDEFIWVYDGTRYLVLLGSEKYDSTSNYLLIYNISYKTFMGEKLLLLIK